MGEPTSKRSRKPKWLGVFKSTEKNTKPGASFKAASPLAPFAVNEPSSEPASRTGGPDPLDLVASIQDFQTAHGDSSDEQNNLSEAKDTDRTRTLNARLTASKKLNSAVRLLVGLVRCLQGDNHPVVAIPSLSNVQDLDGSIKSTADFIQATLNATLSCKHEYPLRMFTKAIQKVCKLTSPFLKNFLMVAASSSSVISGHSRMQKLTRRSLF